MNLKPISIESVFQPGELVRIFEVDDPLTFAGYNKLAEVTTDANGVATWNGSKTAGKTLCAACHVADGTTGYSRFRVLTD